MKLVVVDIQPEYESNTSFDIGDMLRKASEDYSEVLFLFNGEDTLGMISESALKDFYFEKLDYDEETFEELLGKSTFFDKGYGFFRDVMDSEVCFDRSSIVKIVKYMIDNDVQDIRDLDEDDVDAIGVSELLFDDLEDYGFYLPELADELPRWSGSDLAGGARNECMAEVEILGAAQGLSFNHIDDFIYEGENRYSSIMTESILRSYIRELLVESNKAAEIRDYYGIDLWMKGPYGGDQYEPDIVEIESLVVPEEKRGQGIATDVMFELVRWADSNGYILALDPSSDFGSSVSRLRKFYSQFGFSGNKGRKKDYRTRYAMIRYPKNKVLKEEARQSSFKYKGSSNYFRVDLPGIGYAEGGEHLRLPACQSDVDALMKTPEYLAAEKKYVESRPPRTELVRDEETGKYVDKEIGPAIFRPKFYDINNAWITNPENRGKGYGKEIYKAFIDQATEYSKNYGGVFIGAHHCTIGSGTSAAAKRVWKSLAREYNSSGDVIFIGL